MEPNLVENLPAKYYGFPLTALGFSSRKEIAILLNPNGQLTAHIKYENNYRGLAELAGFTYPEIRNFERLTSPTEEMLQEWTDRTDLSPTIGCLWNHLSFLERIDVLTECLPLIERDCEAYLERKARFEPPLQEHIVSDSTDVVPPDRNVCVPMTRHDVMQGSPTNYDAFVCYNDRGPDHDFVLLLISKLEREQGLKLFIPQRDELGGSDGDTTTARLIEHRCKRMVVVLSPRFLASSSCEFQVQFAHSLDSGTRHKKIIPVLVEECDISDIPEILRHLTLCDYTRTGLHDWFWEKLYLSLKVPLGPTCREDKLCNILALRNRACENYFLSTSNKIGLQDQQDKTAGSTTTLPHTLSHTAASSTQPYTVVPFTSSIQDDRSRYENIDNDTASEICDSTFSQPSSSQGCNEPSSSSNTDLETNHVIYKRSGSPRPQLPAVGNRAPKTSEHAYLPKKRSSSPPGKTDTEPDNKARHSVGPETAWDNEYRQPPKTPVENEDKDEYKDFVWL